MKLSSSENCSAVCVSAGTLQMRAGQSQIYRDFGLFFRYSDLPVDATTVTIGTRLPIQLFTFHFVRSGQYIPEQKHNLGRFRLEMVDDEEAVQKRPRISRFDVLPATQDSIPQQGFAFEPFSVPNGFKLAFDSISKQPQLYVSATDPTFQAKLESAMEKNLRYLQKLDELALQAKTLDVPFQTLRDAKSSGKQLKFIKLFNPSRKPLKTGNVGNRSCPIYCVYSL
jgi:hypothetical protein